MNSTKNTSEMANLNETQYDDDVQEYQESDNLQSSASCEDDLSTLSLWVDDSQDEISLRIDLKYQSRHDDIHKFNKNVRK